MPPVAVAIGLALSGAVGVGVSVTTAAFIGNLVIGTSVSFAVGGISRALTPKPKVGKLLDSPQGRLVSSREPAADRRIIYGRQRIGGKLTFMNAMGTDNEWFHIVLTLSGCQLSEIEKLYLDGEEIPLSGFEEMEVFDQETGQSLGTQLRSLAFGRYEGYLYLEANLGADDQPAFPSLINDAPQLWTQDHRQRGCAGVYLRFRRNEALFLQGLPQVTFDVKGKAVYDPRTGTTVYTNNAALVWADYMTMSKLKSGLGADRDTELDEAALIAAANICDEPITLPPDAAGGARTEPRYTIDGMFDVSEKPGEVIERMLQAMAGHMLYIGGKFAVVPGAYRLPFLTLTDSDFIAPLQVQSKRSFRDLCNTVRGTFLSEERRWQETDFPMVQPAAYLAEDGELLVKDVFLPFTISQFTAQRLASIDLERNRRQVTVQATCGMRAYALQPGDVVRVTHARFAWTLKTFEVLDAALIVTEGKNGGPVLAVDLTLQESDVDVYGFAVDDFGETVASEDVRLIPELPPPAPADWELAADLYGNLVLRFTIPKAAHYSGGEVVLLAHDDSDPLTTTLATGMASTDSALEVVDADGFRAGDWVRIGNEILQIAGPGIAGIQVPSTTWQLARGQKLTQPAAASGGAKVTRLKEIHLQFMFVIGFTIANPGLDHALALPHPGQVRPYHASLQFWNDAAKSSRLEQAVNFDADNVIAPAVSLTAVAENAELVFLQSITWTNPADADYGGVNVYVKGWLGVNDWRLAVFVPATQASFTNAGPPTGETVYYKFVSVNRLGAESEHSTSPGADDSISKVWTTAVAPVTGISASEGPAFAADGAVASRITASFTKPVPLGLWDHVQIWATGYQGSANGRFLAWSRESPCKFDLETTGETITLEFVSVNANGAGNFGSGPTVQALLDGQTSAPAAPSNVAAISNANTAGKVLVSWSENLEADIDGYQVARRTDDSAPTDADIIAPNVFAGGEEATAKASYLDVPGANVASYRYRVRAVNRSGLKSAWSAAATVQALAPDGTTDTAVPTAPVVTSPVASDDTLQIGVAGAAMTLGKPEDFGHFMAVRALQSNLNLFTANNYLGAFEIEFIVTHYSNSAETQDALTTRFSESYRPETQIQLWRYPLDNRFLGNVQVRVRNYFGWSALGTISGSDVIAANSPTGSQAQGVKPPTANFDPAIQDYGVRQMIAKAGAGDIVLSPTDASGRVRSTRVMTSDVGYQVGGVAPFGQYLRGDGAKAAFAFINAAELPVASPSANGIVTNAVQTFGGAKYYPSGISGRSFNQASRPTLLTGETAFWRRSSDGFAGLLHFDGSNYFWWAAPSDGATAVKCFGNP